MKFAVRLSLALLCMLPFATPARAQLVRQNNTTLKFPAAPTTSATGQFELVEFFPGMQFDRPVCVASPPGDERLFVVERAGRIWVVTNLDSPTKQLFLDISDHVHASTWSATDRRTEGLSSVAFHPNFAANHRFFVTYNTVTTTAAGSGHHNRVAEFLATNDNGLGIKGSEVSLITQYDEGDGHNINDLHFGPDGYLYIATGDEGDGGTGDDFNNAQKIDKDFFSAIMRIDVDKKAGNLTPNAHPASSPNTYKIPADNPYVGATSFNGIAVDPKKVRTEFYAVGFRNPWRFSFDPQTGKIYEGDVGQHDREEINIVVKGGNYGWSFKEGTMNGPKIGSMPAGFTSIPPIHEYIPGFTEEAGMSVTCGVVYRGAAIPALAGNLVFADYQSGNLWTMNIDMQPYTKKRLLGAGTGIAGFGYDPRNGDVLVAHHDSGKILRLQYTSSTIDNLPPTLADTGIFSDLTTLTPNPGIYSYDVNVPLWSDGALKQRWFSIPGGQKIHFEPEANWSFPTGSVWIKHFDLLINAGDPSSKRRVETRVLVKTEEGLYGVTYKWEPRSNTATLVPDSGDSRSFVILDNGTTRTQIWHFPSRSECLSCHTAAGGRILGFNTAQLNRDYGYGSVSTNQLSALGTAGFLDNAPEHPPTLRALAGLDDETASRTYRVRSYLFANCGQCHQPAANIYADWDSRITTPLTSASIIRGTLRNSTGPDDKVITPGSTNTSAIVKRMCSLGKERMPPLGTSIIDDEAVKLISNWIEDDLPQFQTFDAWAAANFPDGAIEPDGDADGDGISNYIEYLMGSDPKRADVPPLAEATIENGEVKLSFKHPADRGVFFEWTGELSSSNWRPVVSPENKLLFPAETATRTITDALSGERKYYRMRVVEP